MAAGYAAEDVWSIPAWAGETRSGEIPFGLTGVYPRVGGGNLGMVMTWKSLEGLSPRGRGKLLAKTKLDML